MAGHKERSREQLKEPKKIQICEKRTIGFDHRRFGETKEVIYKNREESKGRKI